MFYLEYKHIIYTVYWERVSRKQDKQSVAKNLVHVVDTLVAKIKHS